ncbi:MAG: alpha/beta hydrolase family protein [Planctomycetota bacterium]
MIKTVAEDGLRLDGVLHPAQPHAQPLSAPEPLSSAARLDSQAPSEQASNLPRAASLPVVDGLICLHGVGSNYYGSSLFEALTPSLTALGVPVAWVNTRGRDNVFAANTRQGRRWLGAAFEVVGECAWDVAGWLRWAERRGWRRVGLIGHSLGAIKAVFSQAQSLAQSQAPAPGSSPSQEQSPDPASVATGGLVSLVAALSPPWLCYRLFQNDPNGAAFFDAITRARKHVAAGEPEALIRVQYPYPLLISAGSYVDKYGPGEQYDIVPLVPRLNCPVLFTYGQAELETGGVAFAGVPEAVRAAARPGQAVSVAVVPGADHNYTRCAAPLAEVLLAWFAGEQFAANR